MSYTHIRLDQHANVICPSDHILEVSSKKKYNTQLPNFQMIGTGMTNRYAIESFPLVATTLELTKPEASLFKLIYAAYDRDTGLSFVDSTDLTPSQRSKKSKIYNQLKERGLVKRVKQKTYMINPSAVINTSLYESLKVQWDNLK